MGLVEVTRAPLVPTAISNIWMVTIWTFVFEPGRLVAQKPLGLALMLTAGVAIGMWGFGMTLNDLMDARRDRLFKKDRPIPSGRVTTRAAMATALFCLLLGLFCAAMIGLPSTLMCLLCATLIVIYNTAGKHLPAIGLMLLAMIRATHMLIANPGLKFAWPVWVAFTFVLLISGVAYVLEHKRPRLYPQEVWGLVFGWTVFSLMGISWMLHRGALSVVDAAMVWVGPLAAGAVFAGVGYSVVRFAKNRREGGEALMTNGLMWLIVFDAAWLIGAGLWGWGVPLLGLYFICRSGVATMRLYKRELAGDQVQPSR